MNRHFLTLLKRGRFPASSSGERRVYLLAIAIIENVGPLDDAALAGVEEFLRFAWSNPNKARDLVEGGEVDE